MRISSVLVMLGAVGCVGPPQQLPDASPAVRVQFVHPVTLQLVSRDGDTVTVHEVTSAVGRVRSRSSDTLVISMTSVRANGVTIDADGRDAPFDSTLTRSIDIINASPEMTGILFGLSMLAVLVLFGHIFASAAD